ncbi:sensor histidine kinase [Mucilaginibacter sp. AK015]|uniref:sensor histidine kinase n=1 Tax=Mucilaginibacter sp. AK015 TaxID=2723072 RepID=UPI00161AD793|nr:ATP-binding protein [Mucilaginibacter sp. AK015]MBB5394058.1 signal transduction histidine kinase [Mucilaginibacter sp. AK015]
MHFFTYLALFLLAMRLRKSIKLTPAAAKWNMPLYGVALGTVGLFFLLDDFIPSDEVNGIVIALVLLGVVQFLKREPDFERFRVLINAHYPLIVVAVVANAVELATQNFEFSHTYDNYWQTAQLVAFGWIFLRVATSKKQQSELKRISERKDELEILVAARTAEITQQRNELQETVKELQATQAQLIQQEKLASLGELTAGIAHEIQNPLNFVNNFSEVSMELIEEMEEEMAKGDIEEANAIAADIKQNLEKIRHHGKRADGIVKGMLQHSRASSNVKEPTNLNTIADEYFRLAYHGLRAKDKSFNAELVSNLDPNLPSINMVSQDVGRVLLNMFTNAFYAVHQKQKIIGGDFKPRVEVSTRTIVTPKGQEAEIMIKDNGSGIPDAIKDKIMQPFFTTKPAGEGTGLGLSLSYDIIVKAHKGHININSKVGEGSEFIITLPIA